MKAPTKKKVISAFIPEETWKKISKAAMKKRMSVSRWVAEVLEGSIYTNKTSKKGIQ